MSEYFTMGEKVTPDVQEQSNDEDHAYGPGWAAERAADRRIFLEWDAGQLMSKYVRAEISEDEFQALLADADAFPAIRALHDPYQPGSSGGSVPGSED
jgi:hypothetical protein